MPEQGTAEKRKADISSSSAASGDGSDKSSSSSSSQSSDSSSSKRSSSSSSSSSGKSSSSSDSKDSKDSASPTPPRKRSLSRSRQVGPAKPPSRRTSPETKRRRLTPSPRRDRSSHRQRERGPDTERHRGRDEDRGRHRSRDWDRHKTQDRESDRHRPQERYHDRRGSRDRGRRRESPLTDQGRQTHRAEKPPQRRQESRDARDQELPGPPRQSERHSEREGGRGREDRRDSSRPKPDGPDGLRDADGREVWGTKGNRLEPKKEAKAIEPNFGLSGALAEETNKVNGVVLVYSEPPEASNPTLRWRLYTFKGGELVGEPLYIHRQSSYMFGRERRVADIPADHPSCSKQHAVLQYRRTTKDGLDGMPVEAVRPYLMDLGSTNGTFINNERLDAQRFYELMEKDVVKLGNSSREYVLLHEGSLTS